MAAHEHVSMETGKCGSAAKPSAPRKVCATGNVSAVRCCQIRAWETIDPNTLPVPSSRRPSKGKLVCGSRPLTPARGQRSRALESATADLKVAQRGSRESQARHPDPSQRIAETRRIRIGRGVIQSMPS